MKKLKKQHLAEPLQRELMRVVNKESLKDWAKQEQPPFPVYKKCDNIKNDKIWRHLLRGIIKTAKELRP